MCVGPREAGFADVGADLRCGGLEGSHDRFRVPSLMAAVFAQDDGFDFLGGELAIFVRDAHVGAAVGVVGLFAAGKGDADAVFPSEDDGGYIRVDFRFDVGGDGLGNFPEGGFADVHTGGGSVVFDAEPEFSRAVFVENGRDGIQAVAKLGEAFFELDGFGFFHGLAFRMAARSFPASGKRSLGLRRRALSMVAARFFSNPGMRSRMGIGFSLRMMSMGSRLGSKR